MVKKQRAPYNLNNVNKLITIIRIFYNKKKKKINKTVIIVKITITFFTILAYLYKPML